MPVDNHKDPSAEPPSTEESNADGRTDAHVPTTSRPPSTQRRRRRFITRRNAIISGIGLVAALIALIFVGLLAYRLGYVDHYVAGQIKNTLATYGVRAEIKTFHTSWSPQTVEMLGVELYV